MSVRVLEEQPLTLADVLELLKRRRGKSKKWDRATHERIASYCQQFLKLPPENAKRLLERLLSIRVESGKVKLSLPRDVAVMIVNVLPKSEEEVTPILDYFERRSGMMLLPELKRKLVEEILSAVREFSSQ